MYEFIIIEQRNLRGKDACCPDPALHTACVFYEKCYTFCLQRIAVV